MATKTKVNKKIDDSKVGVGFKQKEVKASISEDVVKNTLTINVHTALIDELEDRLRKIESRMGLLK